MRILFTFVGGLGHFEPLLPIARAAEAAGHVVAFGCGPPMAARVRAAGCTVFVMGTPEERPPARSGLRAVDRVREERELRDRFARRAARHRVPLTLELCNEWQPQLLVCDETDFGAMVAAERLGLPHATVLVIAAGSFVRADVVGAALDALRAEHGLPPDPTLEMSSRYLVLSPFPPSFRDPAHPLPATAHGFRPPLSEEAEVPPPAWCRVRPGAASVYFTLGTVFNVESGDLLPRVLAALRELPIQLLVTVGHQIDPAQLGPQPDHVHVAQHVPQWSALPFCDLVVSHGGSGSLLGALAHGLASVVIPIGADQPLNAERCVDLGVGRVIDPEAVTAEAVRETVTGVLEDPTYRRNAGRLRDEIVGLPEPARAVALLERLVAERRPLLSA